MREVKNPTAMTVLLRELSCIKLGVDWVNCGHTRPIWNIRQVPELPNFVTHSDSLFHRWDPKTSQKRASSRSFECSGWLLVLLRSRNRRRRMWDPWYARLKEDSPIRCFESKFGILTSQRRCCNSSIICNQIPISLYTARGSSLHPQSSRCLKNEIAGWG